VTGAEHEEDADEEEAIGAAEDTEQPLQPDVGALRGYKEGLIDLLHPGESAFEALRRLGGLQVCANSGGDACMHNSTH
jgi:hypothetical protein